MKTYGNLALAGDTWVIHNLQPHVAIKLKAVFPGVPKSAAVIRFPATPTLAADLAWFCERYPLEASNDDLRALDAARTAFAGMQAEAERIQMADYAPPLLAGLRPGQALRAHQSRNIEILRLFGGLLVADDGSDPPMMDVLGLKASEAHAVVDPDLGVQSKNNDAAKLQKLVQRYLDKVEGSA